MRPDHRSTPNSHRTTLALLLTAVALSVLASSRLQGLLLNTALLAAGTLTIALPLGAVFGVALAKIEFAGRCGLAWLFAGLLFVPLYVQAAAWNGALGTGGWLTQWLAGETYAAPWLAGWRGAIWIHAMGAFPWIALLGAASLRTVERRLEEESLLDATPLAVLFRVSLRRGAGGFWAGAMWTAIVCATEIAVTDLFQIRTYAEEIYTEATLGPLGALPGGLLQTDLAIGVAIIAAAVGVALRLTLPWLPQATSIAADATWRWRPRPMQRRWIAGGVWLLAGLMLAPPLASLVWKAGIDVTQRDGAFIRSWSLAKAATMVAESPWEHRREWGWSLAIGATAMAATTVVGVLLAWQARRPRSARLLAACVAAAIAVPAPLWGVWAIAALNHPADSIWAPLTVLYDRTLLAPAALQTIRALPIVGLWLWSQLASVPRDLLEAARSEGASSFTQLWRVALPLRWTGVSAAAGMALVLAVGELSASLLVLPPGVTTISVRIFQLLHYGVDDRVAALALSVFVAMGAIAILFAAVTAIRTRHRRLNDAATPNPPI
jgi:iron(III) transport system permease protein